MQRPTYSKLLHSFFIETVVKWRTVCSDISAGREPTVDTMPQMPQGGGGGIQPPPAGIRA